MSIQASLRECLALIQGLSSLESQILAAAALLRDTLLTGNKVLVCGNGGSAADSSHLATELACRFVSDRRPYPAINLTADGSLLTATANDYSFDEVFTRQIQAFGRPGDLLIAITTSGNSRNIRRALEEARAAGLKMIALLGRDGGKCRGLADVDLIVAHNATARIQEAHKLIIHLLCEEIEPALGGR
jgi:phosphoheptose isomerase